MSSSDELYFGRDGAFPVDVTGDDLRGMQCQAVRSDLMDIERELSASLDRLRHYNEGVGVDTLEMLLRHTKRALRTLE